MGDTWRMRLFPRERTGEVGAGSSAHVITLQFMGKIPGADQEKKMRNEV